MQPSDIVLVSLPQTDGVYKLRPVLLLKQMPKYHDFLVCVVSAQLHQFIYGIDEILNITDTHFTDTGLHISSVIRLSYLAVVSSDKIVGSIGKIESSLYQSLLQRLARFIITPGY